jgi:hypothetical protein
VEHQAVQLELVMAVAAAGAAVEHQAVQLELVMAVAAAGAAVEHARRGAKCNVRQNVPHG